MFLNLADKKIYFNLKTIQTVSFHDNTKEILVCYPNADVTRLHFDSIDVYLYVKKELSDRLSLLDE